MEENIHREEVTEPDATVLERWWVLGLSEPLSQRHFQLQPGAVFSLHMKSSRLGK